MEWLEPREQWQAEVLALDIVAQLVDHAPNVSWRIRVNLLKDFQLSLMVAEPYVFCVSMFACWHLPSIEQVTCIQRYVKSSRIKGPSDRVYRETSFADTYGEYQLAVYFFRRVGHYLATGTSVKIWRMPGNASLVATSVVMS